MNYKKHYDLLIERARNRNLDPREYVERHHIIPRCLGGDDSESNIAVLLPEEHYLAHLLLVKMNPDNSSLVFAANMMALDPLNKRMNNKRYKWLRKKLSEHMSSTRKGSKSPWKGKTNRYSEETLEKMRTAAKNRDNSNMGKYKRTSKHKEIASKLFTGAEPWNKGKTGLQTLSEETKKKLSKIHTGNSYHLGKKHSKETKKFLSENSKGRIWYTNGIKNCALKPHEKPPVGYYKGVTRKNSRPKESS